MAQVADVVIEMEGRARRGPEKCDRRAPVVAVLLTRRVGVEGREPCEIQRGDRRWSNPLREIAGELRSQPGIVKVTILNL